MREDINPFELRVQIFPTFDNIETGFKKEWEKIFKKCSKTLMMLLIT